MINARQMVLAFLLVAGATARLAWAQSSSGYPGNPAAYPTSYPVGYPAMYSGYGFYDHASTLEEGTANGVANVIHSAGAANLLHSQAARNYQEARSRALDNRQKGVQTYFETLRINRASVAAQRGPRVTTEQMARFAKEAAPERLSAEELDPRTGRILWPAVLEDNVYAPYRERLEELVHQWARFEGQIGSNEYLELQRHAKTMQAELKRHIREYSPADYMKARNVLESLAFEVVQREAEIAKGKHAQAEPGIAGGKLPADGSSLIVSRDGE